MSEAYKQDCAILDCKEEVEFTLIGRLVDQEFQRFSKYYCEFHFNKLEPYLSGEISKFTFEELKEYGY